MGGACWRPWTGPLTATVSHEQSWGLWVPSIRGSEPATIYHVTFEHSLVFLSPFSSSITHQMGC